MKINSIRSTAEFSQRRKREWVMYAYIRKIQGEKETARAWEGRDTCCKKSRRSTFQTASSSSGHIEGMSESFAYSWQRDSATTYRFLIAQSFFVRSAKRSLYQMPFSLIMKRSYDDSEKHLLFINFCFIFWWAEKFYIIHQLRFCLRMRSINRRNGRKDRK